MPPIPPAWTNVVVSDDPNAHVVATGYDVAGRKQRLYSKEHNEGATKEKFQRVRGLINEMDHIQSEIECDLMGTEGLDYENVLVAYLIFETGIRPGSNADTLAQVKAYGATTLQLKHVIPCSRGVRLQFIGKKGVPQNVLVTNPYLVEQLLARKQASTSYTASLFNCTANSLREYVSQLGSGQYSPKDFRTARGTSLALKLLGKRVRLPATKSGRKKIVNEALDKVAKMLGNTRAVSRKSYVDPEILEQFWAS